MLNKIKQFSYSGFDDNTTIVNSTRKWLKDHFICLLIAGSAFTFMLLGISLTFYYYFTCNNTAHAEAVLIDNGGSGWELQWTTAMSRDIYAHQNPQGVALFPDNTSFVLSGSNVLHKTNLTFASELLLDRAIPAQFAAENFKHIGDVSAAVYAGEALVFAAIENEPNTQAKILTYTALNLTFRDACSIPQRHASFAAVYTADTANAENTENAENTTVYFSEYRDVTEIKRYAYPGCAELEPLRLRRDNKETTLNKVQGATVAGRTLFLTTDAAAFNRGNIFAVNMDTGDIELAMTLEIDGEAEMEGIEVFESNGCMFMVITLKLCSTPYAVQLMNPRETRETNKTMNTTNTTAEPV